MLFKVIRDEIGNMVIIEYFDYKEKLRSSMGISVKDIPELIKALKEAEF